MAITNIALKKAATASGFVMPYQPSKAVDGSYTVPVNRWLCNAVSSTKPAILTVNLGGMNVITSWIVRHMSVAGWRSPDYNMCDFKLQGSFDNNTWFDIDAVVNNTVGITSRTIASFVTCNFVRLYVTKGLKTNTQLASVMEFEVYGQATPYLQALSVNNGAMALSPSFTPLVFAYTIPNVPYSTSSINVAPTLQDPRATVKVNGVLVANGANTPVSLNEGSNVINVVVMAADGTTTQTYTVTVVRDAPVANLTNLVISSGELSPAFSSNTLAYTTGNVAYDTSSITVTPTTDISGATITVNGIAATNGQPATVNLNVGSNVISVVVTNGSATKTYTVTVVRASSPYLVNLQVKVGMAVKTMSPLFAVVNLGPYTVNLVATDIPKVFVSANEGATITVNGTPVVSGGFIQITTSLGDNFINVTVVSATGGDTKTYNLNLKV